MSKPLRVLHVCPRLPRADEPGTMAPAERQIKSITDLGFTTHIYDMRGTAVVKYFYALPRIRKLAKEVDLVHAHFGYCGWLVWIATRLMRNRPRLVMSFMGDDLLGTPGADGSLQFRSRLEAVLNSRFVARQFDQVIVKSQEMADLVAPCECTVIPNGVDTGVFAPRSREESRRELNLPLDRKLVLFPGNQADPRKGHSLAAAAVASAQKMIDDEIEIVHLWNIDPTDVSTYMNACDAMLMMSLIEGSPNVVKEALACNLPTIGVVVGDVVEMLKGVTGCSVCPRDPITIGQQLADVLRNNPSCNGREILSQRALDLHSVALRVLTVYESALGKVRYL